MKNIIKYKDFYASIYYEEETNTFWGKIEGIEDIVSFEADSIEELKKEFKDTVEEYLKECKELNKNPFKQYKGSFNVRVEPEVHKKAAMLAEFNNMSLNKFVELAIKEKITVYEKN